MSGIDKLSEFTGLSRSDVVSIVEKVKRNSAALNACGGHAFEEMPSATLIKRFRCTHCGGEVDSHAHHWYEMGRKHAGAA